jgi:hypothetical protein
MFRITASLGETSIWFFRSSAEKLFSFEVFEFKEKSVACLFIGIPLIFNDVHVNQTEMPGGIFYGIKNNFRAL